MSRGVSLLAVLVALLLVAGCADDDIASNETTVEPPGESEPSPDVTATDETVGPVGRPDDLGDPDPDDAKDGLEEVLVTLDDARRIVGDRLEPFGPEPDEEEDPICNGERASDQVEPDEVAVGPAFAPGQQGPVVSSDAWRFADDDTASAWVDAVQGLLAECIGVVQYEAADGTITIEWEPVATFDLLGDRTIAYRGTSTAGLDLLADWVIVQDGNTVVDVLHLDLSGEEPDAGATQDLVDLVVANAD
jgi:hypothetical protein